MPIKIEYTADEIGVVTRAYGKVTLSDIMESSRKIFVHKNFADLRYWLVLRESDSECLVGIPDMKEIFLLHGDAASVNPELNVALVSNSARQHIIDLIYESHMSLFDGFKTNIFGGQQSAEQWINSAILHTDSDATFPRICLHDHQLSA